MCCTWVQMGRFQVPGQKELGNNRNMKVLLAQVVPLGVLPAVSEKGGAQSRVFVLLQTIPVVPSLTWTWPTRGPGCSWPPRTALAAPPWPRWVCSAAPWEPSLPCPSFPSQPPSAWSQFSLLPAFKLCPCSSVWVGYLDLQNPQMVWVWRDLWSPAGSIPCHGLGLLPLHHPTCLECFCIIVFELGGISIDFSGCHIILMHSLTFCGDSCGEQWEATAATSNIFSCPDSWNGLFGFVRPCFICEKYFTARN